MMPRTSDPVAFSGLLPTGTDGLRLGSVFAESLGSRIAAEVTTGGFDTIEELEQARDRARGSGVSVTTGLGDVDTGPTPLPRWYKAVMFGMLILGLLWIVVYYLTQGLLPIPQLAGGNILVGFGIALVGFLMMTRWSE